MQLEAVNAVFRLARLLLQSDQGNRPALFNHKDLKIMHKKTLLAAAIALAVPFAVAQAQAPAAAAHHAPSFKTHILRRAELDALLAQPEQVVVIDVRRPDEIQKIGSLPVYLSIQAADIQKNLGFIPRDRQIITVSNHAGRAGKVGDALTAAGFKVAGAVGVEFYEKDGGTLSKIVPPPPRTGGAGAK